MDDLLTIKQVAILLKVHHLTIRRYISQGKLKAIRVGGNVRISQKDLNSFSENYIPTEKPTKIPSAIIPTTPFQPNDSLFRLRGRGLSLDDFSK